MRNKFNFIFASVLVGTLFVGCSKQSPEQLIASAKDNIVNGDRQTAIVELKNAITSNSQLYEPRILLGKVYLMQSLFEAAEKELLKGLDLGAPDSEVYPSLVKVYYYQNDFDRVINTVARVIVTNPDTQSTLSLYEFLARIKSGEVNSSVTAPDDLIGDHKLLAEAYLAYVRSDLSEAKNIISRFGNAEEEIVEKAYLKGLLANRERDFSSAIDEFETVLTQYPNYHLVRFILIDTLIKDEKLEEAEKNVDMLLAINKNHGQANFYKASIAFLNSDFQSAFDHSQLARENRFDSVRNQMINGLSALKLAKYERAYSSLSRASVYLPKEHSVHRLLAQLQLNLGDGQGAAETLANLAALSETDVELFADTANVLLSEGDFGGAINQFVTANDIGQSDAQRELGEGLARIANNDLSGLQNIQKSLELEPGNDAVWIMLAELYLEYDKPKQALKIAQKWQQLKPGRGEILLGQVYEKMGDIENAKASFLKALELNPNSVVANNNLIKLAANENDLDEVFRLTKLNLQWDPSNTFGPRTLLALAKQQQNFEGIEQLFEDTASAFPDSLDPILMLVAYYRISEQPQRAIETLLAHKSDLNGNGLQALGDSYFKIKEYKKAEEIYKQWKEREPNKVAPVLRLIGIASEKGDSERALNLVNQSLTQFPGNGPLKLLKVHYAMQSSQYSIAKQEVETLVQHNYSNPLLLKYRGELALVDKQYPQALDFLSKYYQTNMQFDNARLLAIAMLHNNQQQQAEALMEEQISNFPESIRVKLNVAEFMTQNNAKEKAERIYNGILETQPDNAVVKNNLANIYMQRGEFDKAIVLAKQIADSHPHVPQFLDTYGWALYKNNQKLEAKPLLTLANQKLPNDPEIAIHLAIVMNATGETEQALQLLGSVKPLNQQQSDKIQELQNNWRS